MEYFNEVECTMGGFKFNSRQILSPISFNVRHKREAVAHWSKEISFKEILLKPYACSFIKKETLAQLFSCEFCEISKNTFSYRTPRYVQIKSSFSDEKNISGEIWDTL